MRAVASIVGRSFARLSFGEKIARESAGSRRREARGRLLGPATAVKCPPRKCADAQRVPGAFRMHAIDEIAAGFSNRDRENGLFKIADPGVRLRATRAGRPPVLVTLLRDASACRFARSMRAILPRSARPTSAEAGRAVRDRARIGADRWGAGATRGTEVVRGGPRDERRRSAGSARRRVSSHLSPSLMSVARACPVGFQ